MLDAAIIGMGRWGRTLVDSVQGKNEAGIRFVAGCTGTPAKARDYAAEKGIALHDSLTPILADKSIGAIVLATPHAQHAEQVIAAAAAGKHVFVEKPFTLSQASAAAAVAACQKAGVVMALGHNRRFLPAVAEMKRMLAAGEFGTILHLEGQFSGPGALGYQRGQWRADRSESPLGGMGGMGIHMVDMMVNLGGPIAEVTCTSVTRALDNGLDDTTAALFRFASGATGTFATLAYAPRFWRIAVFGTDAWAALHGHENLVVCRRDGTPQETVYPVTDIEAAELEAFARAAAGGPAYPLPVEDAVHGVAVFEAMIGAAASGSTYRVA